MRIPVPCSGQLFTVPLPASYVVPAQLDPQRLVVYVGYMDATSFRTRVGRCYQVIRQKDKPHGAVAWFARASGYAGNSISRMALGKLPVSEKAVRWLERAEQDVREILEHEERAASIRKGWPT